MDINFYLRYEDDSLIYLQVFELYNKDMINKLQEFDWEKNKIDMLNE